VNASGALPREVEDCTGWAKWNGSGRVEAEAALFATALADEDELEYMAGGKLEEEKLLEAAALRNARCSRADMIGEKGGEKRPCVG
jgi:hypothetical protein